MRPFSILHAALLVGLFVVESLAAPQFATRSNGINYQHEDISVHVGAFEVPPRTDVYIPEAHLEKRQAGGEDNSTDPPRPHYRWLSPEYKYVFSRPLPIPPVLAPLTSYTNSTSKEIFDFYEITINPLQQQIYPGLQKASFIGYNGIIPGPHIKAEVGRRSVVRFINNATQPASIHLHGSPTRPPYDGWAEDITMPGEYKDYVYPNENARSLWFHDHALGNTAMNVYKGQVGIYWITNPKLEKRFQLPQGKYDIPLTLTDRRYFQSGRLWDHIGEETTQDDEGHIDDDEPFPDTGGHVKTEFGEAHSFYGDIIHVNGMPWPYMEVEARKYRFRFLGASVSRSYKLSFQDPHGEKIPFHVIGTDSGFIEAPVPTSELILAPSERYEVVIDFTNYLNQTVHLKNARGFSKNEDFAMTHFVTQFVVGPRDPHGNKLGGMGALPKSLVTINYPVNPGVIDRELSFDFINRTWRIEGIMFKDKEHRVLQKPKLGSVEVWKLVNTAGTWSHPVHIHLVDFKVINRTGGANRGVEPYENGYKDIVYLEPFEIVTVIARFLPWPGQYMMHCHNLIHEDSDMMAVFDVNDSLANQTKNGDAFSDPMDLRYRAKPYLGPTDLSQIRNVLLPSISAMDVYPKHVVEAASRFLGGGVTNYEVMDTTQANAEATVEEEELSGTVGTELENAAYLIVRAFRAVKRFVWS